MKKIFNILLVYTILSGLACFLIGAFVFKIPFVSASDVFSYKINNGLLLMLEVLPSSVITGFLVACAVYFGTVEVSAYARFSNQLAACLKDVIIIAVFATFGLSMAHDVFAPALELRKAGYEQKPVLIKQYMELAQNNLLKSIKDPDAANYAVFYAKKVLEIDPKNESAIELSKRAEFARASKLKKKKNGDKEFVPIGSGINGNPEKIDTSEIDKMYSSSVLELIQESQKLFDQKDYLGSHYYAQMAVKMADEKDINLPVAKNYANRAWNIISQARAEEETEENRFFKTKVKGYTELNAGNYMEAYYIYQSLHNQKDEYAKDPDVKRYLNKARDELTKNYFFNDETEDANSFESAENVYFSLHYHDGTYDIFFIRGISDVGTKGKLVRYLRELHIFSFDAGGNLIKSGIVPYAKMLAIDASSLSDVQIKNLGIDAKWKTVPYLQLCSVDRDEENSKVSPVYMDKKGEKVPGPEHMFFSMPYDDFTVLSQCSNGIQKINFWSMSKMKLSAANYGYSEEIILQNILRSVFYPFMIFILLVLCASIGWNYRLESKNLFKFIWVFIIPLFNVVMYGAVGFMEFLIRIFNFIFMGLAGTLFALYLGIAFYVVWIIVVCFIFLSRKGD
ncbi:MAG: hypothetical protein J6Y36_09110 [Treponema sp.]|nr:hypothetical protein [Treponema sp.]